jgi:L-aspartate oxidase
MRVRTDEAIIVGSGIGGLVCALSMAPRSVTVITKTQQLEGGSSVWAQGGIAAAIGPGDSPEAHAEDTVAAGAGLSDAAEALHLTAEGVAGVRWLIDEGVPFDRGPDGELLFGKEAAHSFPRIVHAGGDATGYVLMQSLIARVRETPAIDVVEDTFAYDLVLDAGRVCGVVTFSAADGWVLHCAPVVVIATGGIGMVWRHTTNPLEATGDGLAMAARAGAELADLEFVQFHPTALAADTQNGGANLPLLTEALRGAGATLVDERGVRFMAEVHPDAELAPRDVVARAIHGHVAAGHRVYLDIRKVLAREHGAGFPTAVRFAREAGLDPYTELLPVAPAAHYHMGGVAIDARGRTSLAGLWACGEVATTGIHGANRLASNSLLEALVFARDVAEDIGAHAAAAVRCEAPEAPVSPLPAWRDGIARIVSAARDVMSRHVGIVRDGDGLRRAAAELAGLDGRLAGMAVAAPSRRDRAARPGVPGLVRDYGEARNLLLVARLVTAAALTRTESRGAHFRQDFPDPAADWRHSQRLTIGHLDRAS